MASEDTEIISYPLDHSSIAPYLFMYHPHSLLSFIITLLGPLERADLQHWTLCSCLPPQLRKERDPVSETLCYLLSSIPDDGQSPKTSNSEYYTPSAEP
jgi:hypothetical protein